MRHRKKNKVLDRGTSHRKALVKNLCRAFFEHEKIKTTETKAKVVKASVERLITIGKNNSLTSRRLLIKELGSNDIASKILKEISPRYKDRKGGYTKIIKLGGRQGDGAPIVQLILV